MIVLSHFVVCSDVITDRTTNEVSYIRILEELSSVELPLVSGQFYVCVILEADSIMENLVVKISMISPANTVESLGSYLISKPIARVKLHVALAKVLFKEYGRHRFIISAEKDGVIQAMAQIPIYIRQLSN